MANGYTVGPRTQTKQPLSGAARRQKGYKKEQQIARELGGKRMVMSGGSILGGGDLVFPVGHPLADFLWEVKARKLVPQIIREALTQAQVEANAQGGRKKPASVICGDNLKPVVCFFLDDFKEWVDAFTEMEQPHKLKALARDLRRVADEITGMA